MNTTLLTLVLYLGVAGAFDDGKIVFTDSKAKRLIETRNVNSLRYEDIKKLTDKEREYFINLINPNRDPLYNLTTKELMLIDPRD